MNNGIIIVIFLIAFAIVGDFFLHQDKLLFPNEIEEVSDNSVYNESSPTLPESVIYYDGEIITPIDYYVLIQSTEELEEVFVSVAKDKNGKVVYKDGLNYILFEQLPMSIIKFEFKHNSNTFSMDLNVDRNIIIDDTNIFLDKIDKSDLISNHPIADADLEITISNHQECSDCYKKLTVKKVDNQLTILREIKNDDAEYYDLSGKDFSWIKYNQIRRIEMLLISAANNENFICKEKITFRHHNQSRTYEVNCGSRLIEDLSLIYGY